MLPLLTAAAPIGAALISGIFGAKGARDANQANLQIAREQMDFQERMSNTSYQRAVQDLQAAGLNPMLAYSQGGSSTPSGASTTFQNELGGAVASAMQGMQLAIGLEQARKTAAETKQVEAVTGKVISETMDQQLNTAFLKSQIDKLVQDARTGKEDETLRRTQDFLANLELNRGNATFASDVAMRKAQSLLTQQEVPRSTADAKFYEGLGQANPYLRMVLDILRNVNFSSAKGRP